MSGLDELDELSNDINDEYDDERNRIVDSMPRNARRMSYDSMSKGGVSIRDMEQPDEATDIETTRMEMLEAWQHLIKSLYEYKVYLQHAPALEKLFSQVRFFDQSMWQTSKVLLELMVETVDNNAKGTEIRYVTLLEILSSYTGH